MTFTVKVAVTTKSIAVAASAPAAGQYQGTILNANHEVVQQQVQDVADFAFPTIPAGDYGVTVCRLDANGDVIAGSVVATTFSTGPDAAAAPAPAPVDAPVEPSYVTIDVPGTIFVTATQE